MTSLPTPLSPVMRIGTSASATRPSSASIRRMAGETPSERVGGAAWVMTEVEVLARMGRMSMTREMVSMSSSLFSGLVTQSLAPTRIAWTTSWGSSMPETMMTGTAPPAWR